MRRLGFILILCGCQGAPPPSGEPPASALPSGVYSVSGIDPGRPIDDLAPLAAIVGDAQVVGLGESVHTSGGITLAKARLTRYLVETQGFRVLALEVPRADADVAGAWVAACEGDPTDAARHLGVWADTNTRDLLGWMCAWNGEHPADRVHLFGFDVQQPWADAPALRKFLVLAAAPGDQGQLIAGMARCDGADATDAADYQAKYGLDRTIPSADRDACTAGLDALDQYLTAHASELVAASSQGALDQARVDLASFRGWQGYRVALNGDARAAMDARDAAMDAVFEGVRAMHFPSARTVIWAHDDHVARDHAAIQGSLADGAAGMGGALAAHLGGGYVAIAVTGWDVEVNWPGSGCARTATPAADSVEATLHGLGVTYLLVDFAPRGPVAPPFAPSVSYGFGAGEHLVPAAQFRAALYLDRSPPMDSLLWQCN